jgi:molybdopterin converting factor small subunit
MAVVWVPALMRPLAGGAEQVRASGATLRAVIDDLEQQYPGFRERLLDGAAIRQDIALAIGDAQVTDLNASVSDDSEIHILPAIAGG